MIGVLPEIKWPPFICKANTNSAGYRSIVWALCWSHNDAGTLDYPGLRSIFKCMRFFFFSSFFLFAPPLLLSHLLGANT